MILGWLSFFCSMCAKADEPKSTKALHICICRALSWQTPRPTSKPAVSSLHNCTCSVSSLSLGLLLERVVSCSLIVLSLQHDTTDDASIDQYLYVHLSIAINEQSTGIFAKKMGMVTSKIQHS